MTPSSLQISEITLFRDIKSHFRVINYIIIGIVECIARGAFGAALATSPKSS